jgi:hypothetical protein
MNNALAQLEKDGVIDALIAQSIDPGTVTRTE